MKKLIVLAALALSLCAPAALGQEVYEERTNTPTSMFSVRVYLNNRVVDVLPPGKRARILKTKGRWIYIEYRRGERTYEGWIRR
jgi:hypothetical protein